MPVTTVRYHVLTGLSTEALAALLGATPAEMRAAAAAVDAEDERLERARRAAAEVAHAEALLRS